MSFLITHKGSDIPDQIIPADFYEVDDRFIRFYKDRPDLNQECYLVSTDGVYSITNAEDMLVSSEYMDKIIKADIDNVCANIRGDDNGS